MVTEIKVVLISFLFWWIKQLHWKSNNGKLLLYKMEKKPKWLYNKAQKSVTKMTYVRDHDLLILEREKKN